MTNYRKDKVSELLKNELATMIRQEFSEKYGIVSVNSLELSSDLRNAKVYISSLNEKEIATIITLLQDRARYYQSIIGKKLRMKFTPTIEFIVDKYQDKIYHIDKLLDEIKK